MVLSRGGNPVGVQVPYPIKRIGAQEILPFICLTQSWVWLMLHWSGSKPVACSNERECDYCKRGHKSVWAGYVIGRSHQSEAGILIPLTALAAYTIQQWEWRNDSLNGAMIELRRQGLNAKGSMCGKIVGWKDDVRSVDMDNLEHAVKTIYKLHGRTVAAADTVADQRIKRHAIGKMPD